MSQPAKLQSAQYTFPYHHIPHFDCRGAARRTRLLRWGLEYLICSEFVLELLADTGAASVVDIGCGDGFLLSRMPPHLIRAGIDIDERALSFARAFCPSVEFQYTDVREPTAQYDAATLVEVLEHIPDGETTNFLSACMSWVKPGGSLIITVPSDNVPLNAKHYQHYSTQTLANEIAVALPECNIACIGHFYRMTFSERIYCKLTDSALLRGDIPVLQPLIWQIARAAARKANAQNSTRIFAVIQKFHERRPHNE